MRARCRARRARRWPRPGGCAMESPPRSTCVPGACSDRRYSCRMALRPVLQFPDKRLTVVAKPIEQITDEIRQLAQDMCEVMYDEPGIGLAATQVGEPVRLIVVDTEWKEENHERNPLILVNPELSEQDGEVLWKEGCLSVPDFEAEAQRAERLLLRALDLDGKEAEIRADGHQGCCSHEGDDHRES